MNKSMGNIDVYNNVDVTIRLSDEEKDILTKAYKILREISKTLWQEEADETETFCNVSTANDCIYNFMKNDCGVNVDKKRF